MIARFQMRTPFILNVPENANFILHDYTCDGYDIRFYPPMRSQELVSQKVNREIRVSGIKTLEADVVHIDFSKTEFDRRADITQCDPPLNLILEVVQSYFLRLRHVTKASMIRATEILFSDWNLEYLNDDGSPLEKQKGLVRGRKSKSFNISWNIFTPDTWNDIHGLPMEYKPQPWEPLILDATCPGMPIGSSIVLAATALEVFIAHILDLLAIGSPTPPELWSWINNRKNYLKEPSVEEQFDFLLKMFCGHSLKEESALWDDFMNLRGARNSFVHTGIARIGKNKEVLEKSKAASLVASPNRIIEKIKSWLPQKYHWQEFSRTYEVQASCILLEPKDNSGSDLGAPFHGGGLGIDR